MEVGGRWSLEAYDFLKQLAEAKARGALPQRRGSSSRAYKRRWAAFLSVAGMRAFADTLLYGTAWNTELHEGEGPPVGQLLEQDKYEDAPGGSRLPVRA